MGRAYGIDLGTTYSAIAKTNAIGASEIIADNEQGTETLASAVFFAEDGTVIVGAAAKEEGVDAPERLHQFFKRWIGRSTDPNREHYWADGKEYDPIELSAIVLGRMINYAKDDGEEVKDVVITCPACFDYAQRDATKQAGIAAGLNVMAVINEPIAAAMNYCMSQSEGSQNVLVYDLGGGTFDVTLMRMTRNGNDRRIDPFGIDGDAYLGGCEWDNELYLLLLEKFEEQYGSSADEMPEELKALIRDKVENLKIKLTNKEKAKVKIPYDGENVILEVARNEFEIATTDYVERTVNHMDSVLQKTGMTDDDIDVVLMVGGACKMPMIRNVLTERFGEKVLLGDPDKDVAKGAAIIANIIQEGEELEDLHLCDDFSSLPVKEIQKKEQAWSTEQILDKLQEQIRQGVANAAYTPRTERIEVTYRNDADEEELINIFKELIRLKTNMRYRQGQIGKLLRDSSELLSDQELIRQLQSSLRFYAEDRRRVEKLIKYRLWENMAGLFRHKKGMEELDEILDGFLSSQRRIEGILETLKPDKERYTTLNK